jgi:hypothetical protein
MNLHNNWRCVTEVDWLTTWEAVALAMPFYVSVLRPILRIAGQKDPAPLKIGEALFWHVVFKEMLRSWGSGQEL